MALETAEGAKIAKVSSTRMYTDFTDLRRFFIVSALIYVISVYPRP